MQQLTRLTLAIAASAVLASLIPAPAAGQGMLDRLKKKAEEAAKGRVEDRTEKKAGDATDAALDKAECAVPGKKCDESKKDTAPAAGKSAAAKSAAQQPGEGAWKNYDFVPGDRVIFSENFSAATVGDFPRRLTFKNGNLEVVDWKGARFLSTNTFDSRFMIPLPELLPQRFTLEFDYSGTSGNGMDVSFTDTDKLRAESHITVSPWQSGVQTGGESSTAGPSGKQNRYQDVVFPVRIMADGDYVKVYMGDTRVANVPNAKLGRAKAIWFNMPGSPDRAAIIGNIRVAAGGRKLYEAIAESGRVATQGIYFDIGSDRLRPESSPTLKEIGAMLAEHPELTLTIEGHTDNVGAAAANMTLSQQRATAVKAALVSSYGADAGRLTAKGLGASKPAAPNTTAEGREQNRRVELVRTTP